MMDWKDTVMSSQDIKQLKSDRWGEPARNYDYTLEELIVAKAQAEITWNKIREVVEGAGLTDEEMNNEYESWLDLDVEDENQIKGFREIRNATRQAILKAIGGRNGG